MTDDQNTQVPKQLNIWLVILSLVLVVALIGAFYWYYYNNFYKKSSDSGETGEMSSVTPQASSSTSSTSATLDESNSKLDDNRAFGYTLRYPSSWSISTENNQAETVEFSSSHDVGSKAVVSIMNVSKGTDFASIKDWISKEAENSPEGSTANKNIKYLEDADSGIIFAKIEDTANGTLTYQWICAQNVMSLSYSATSSDYETYMPTFDAILSTLIPCAG